MYTAFTSRGIEDVSSMGELMHELGRAELFDVIRVLAHGPMTCTELSERLEVDHPTACKKLSTLRSMGIVTFRRRKKCHLYSLTDTLRCREHELGLEFSIRLEDVGELIVRSRPHESVI